MTYEKDKLRELLGFNDEYKRHEPNLELFMKRLTVICDFYDSKDFGVDRFRFGEDYRPDMADDVASTVD